MRGSWACWERLAELATSGESQVTDRDHEVLYKAIADFSQLVSEANKAKRALRDLHEEQALLSKDSVQTDRESVASLKTRKKAEDDATASVGRHTSAASKDNAETKRQISLVQSLQSEMAKLVQAQEKLKQSASKVGGTAKVKVSVDDTEVTQAKKNTSELEKVLGGLSSGNRRVRIDDSVLTSVLSKTKSVNEELRKTERSRTRVSVDDKDIDRTTQKVTVLQRLLAAIGSAGGGGGGGGGGGTLFKDAGDASGKLASSLSSLLGIIGLTVAKFVLMAAAVAPAITALASLGGVALSAVSTLTGLASTAAALPGVFLAAGSAIAAVVVAVAPLAGVFKAYAAQQKAVESGGADLAKQQAASARAVQSAADAVTNAGRSIELAERGIGEAQYSAVRAQLALNEARQSAIRTLQDLQTEVSRASLDEEGATISLSRAQEHLNQVNATATSTALDRLDALHSVKVAEASLDDVRRKNLRNSEDLQAAEKKGIDGADSVVAAQHSVEQANLRVADSQYELIQAQKGLVRAQQDLAQAQLDASSSTGAAAKAADEYQRALAKLSPAARSVVEAVIGMKDSWDQLQSKVSGAFFAPILGQMDHLKGFLPVISGLLEDAGGAMGVLTARGIEMVTSGPWKADFQKLSKENVVNIQNMGGAALSLLDAFRHLTVAAAPFTQFLTSALQDGANAFRDWAKAGRESGDIAKYLEKVEERLTRVWDILKNLGGVTASWLKAAEPLTDWLLPALDRVTENWRLIAKAQESATSPLSKWLNDIKPLLTAASELFGDIARDPENIRQVTDLFTALKDNVLPPLVALINTLGHSGALTDVATAFGKVLEAARPISRVILELIGAVASLVSSLPTAAIVGLVAALVAVKAALAIAGVVSALEKGMLALGFSFDVASKGAKGVTLALGGIGLVLTGVALLIQAFSAANEESAKATEANKSGIKELNQALEENAGVTDQAIRSKAAALLEEKGLLQATKDLGLATDVATDGLLGNADARQAVIKALEKEIEAANIRQNQLIAEGKAGAKGGGASAEFQEAQNRAKIAQEQLDSYKNLIQAKEDDAAASARVAAAAGLITAKQKDSVIQQEAFKSSTKGLADEQVKLAKAFADIGSAASSATEKANGLRQAYDLLFGSAISANEAEENFNKTLLELAPTLKTNGTSLALNTQAGLQNRDAIEGVAKSSVDMAIADVAAGESLETATAKHRDRIQALKDSAEAAGLDKDKVQKLIDTYGTIPTDVTTDFAAKNADVVKATFHDILEDIDYLLRNGYLPAKGGYTGTASSDFGLGRVGGSFAFGGFVSGPGTKTSDSVPAWLSTGEYVQNASAVDYYGTSFMDALNKRQVPKDSVKLKDGGRPSFNKTTNPVVRNAQTNPLSQPVGELLGQLAIDFTAVPLALIRALVVKKLKEKKEATGHYRKGGLVGRRARRGYAGGGLVSASSAAPGGTQGSSVTVPGSTDASAPPALVQDPATVQDNLNALLTMLEQFRADYLALQQTTSDEAQAIWSTQAQAHLDVTTTSTESIKQLWSDANAVLLQGYVAFSGQMVAATESMTSRVLELFTNAIASSRSIWDGLKPAVGGPVNTVLGSIINSGLIAGFNKIAQYVKLDPISGVALAQYAEGGKIRGPGGPKADVIPIMASSGEFMQPAAAVDYYGTAFMEAVRQRKLPKFAEGGAIDAGPGADTALSWMQGQTFSDYLSDAQARTNTVFSQIVAGLDDSLGGYPWGETVSKLPAALVGGLAQTIVDAAKALSPPTGHGAPTTAPTWQNMWGVISSQFTDATLNSALRFTDTGYHSKGQAIDIGSTRGEGGMHDIAAWIAKNFPDSTQLIHQPVPPTNILDGHPFDYGPANNADHYDHVHWAMAFQDIVAGLASSGMPEWPGGWGSFGQTSSAVDYSPTAGVEQWRSVALSALAWTGQSQENITSLLRRMQQESGGNPNAINNWDINAQNGVPSQGLMQVIPPTFAAYRDPRLSSNILDPMANIVASINYTLSRYGSLQAGWDRPGGYAEGGLIKLGRMHTGGHVKKTPLPHSASGDPWHGTAESNPWKGQGSWDDTGRYWGSTYMWSGKRTSANPRLGDPSNNLSHDELLKILQEGEFVVSADAVSQPGGAELLEALNSGNVSAAGVMAAVIDMNSGVNTGEWPYGGASASAGNLPTGDIDWEEYFRPKPPPSTGTGSGGHQGSRHDHRRNWWDRNKRRKGHHWGAHHMHEGGRVGFRPSSLYSGLGNIARGASKLGPLMSSVASSGVNMADSGSMVTGNGMSFGDVIIHNPVRERAGTSLRRQLEIFSHLYDVQPEPR
jgi:hypothetical protein